MKLVFDGRSKEGRTAKLKDAQEKMFSANNRQIGGTHYADKTIQPWAAMEAWMTPEQFVGFLRGNAIKYLARADNKGGLEDIKKAQHYIDKLVEFSEGQQ